MLVRSTNKQWGYNLNSIPGCKDQVSNSLRRVLISPVFKTAYKQNDHVSCPKEA